MMCMGLFGNCMWTGEIKDMKLVKAGFLDKLTRYHHFGYLLSCPKCGSKFYNKEEIKRRLGINDIPRQRT